MNGSSATFKARARTLDMVGRQQIAGIPTAISELFKNAHDAFANSVEVDFFRSNRLFLLRDDGFGMGKDEFVDRWLTIATETSIKREKATNGLATHLGKSRPVLGEKGIGRLAIATIAPQVLILTRARRGDVLTDLTAAFINWRAFEIPSLNLHDIQIPIRIFRGGDLPSNRDVRQMVNHFRTRNAGLQSQVDKMAWNQIEADLTEFEIDPLEISKALGKPSLLGDGYGTHFYLLPTSPNLIYDLEQDSDPAVHMPLQKALLGFTTPSFFTDDPNSIIHTAFRDHRTDGICENLIAKEKFFTRHDYQNADHQISGRFDEYGQFKGNVSIYGETVQDHIINWPGSKGRATKCGPFKITFATIEGVGRHSTLPPVEHARILEKTRRIGGLYIYRDGVRIQPYGNTDYDWLKIEFRRSKSASYYYFSYRQMFGIVEVDSNHNHRLREKAGREGFRENRAFRDLRNILENFLIQVAADFFREEGVHGDRFVDHKKDLDKAERHRRARAKKATAKRAKFKRELTKFFESINQESPDQLLMALAVDIETRLKTARLDKDKSQAARQLFQIEREGFNALRELELRYRVSKPRIGLSKALQREWIDYRQVFEEIRSNIADIRNMIESVVTLEATKAGVEVNSRDRIEIALDELGTIARRKTKASQQTTLAAAQKVLNDARKVATECLWRVENTIRDVMADFARCDFSECDEQRLLTERSALEVRIQNALETSSQKLEATRSQLDATDLISNSLIIDELAAVEQSNITLKEQASADLQLAQLGMAIEVISHEFGAVIRSIRSGLRGLKAWADVNRELTSLYHIISDNFEHLDGYLTLFTPLQRRLYRKAIDIHGWEIHEFLTNLFSRRLARHNVKLDQTEQFAIATVRGYPSSFYPVFVNLVDNAIYWLSGQNEGLARRIQLDASDTDFRVSDSGPGVYRLDREAIFDIGFTRKPGGRGMGLHIARETLRNVGHDLNLEIGGSEWSTTFVITTRKDKRSNAER